MTTKRTPILWLRALAAAPARIDRRLRPGAGGRRLQPARGRLRFESTVRRRSRPRLGAAGGVPRDVVDGHVHDRCGDAGGGRGPDRVLPSAFDKYADVLGKYDPATGARTTDKPSLLAILFMQQIALSVADYVLEREMFLDDGERVVFGHVDLSTSPAEGALDTFLDALHTRWLGWPVGAQTLAVLHGQFRQLETAQGTPAAYGRVLALLLQHGGLYYY